MFPKVVQVIPMRDYSVYVYFEDGKIDILNCINKIDGDEFTLNQIYHFVESLALKHPENHYIKDKIRQQLQILRDKGIIEFKGSGHYKKC